MNELNDRRNNCSGRQISLTFFKLLFIIIVLFVTVNILSFSVPVFVDLSVKTRDVSTMNKVLTMSSSKSINETVSSNLSSKYGKVSERYRKSPVVPVKIKEESKEEKETPGNLGNNVDTYDMTTRERGRQNNCSSCFQHNFKYLIQNENICKQYSPDQSIDLIILIMTKHDNMKERMALRSTWLTHTKNNTANVRSAFLLGEVNDNKLKEAVLQENNVYRDIIKEDFIDTYMNLTFKTIMGFKWAATKCVHARYVMKTDDDMFVNVPNVLNIFKGPHSETLKKAVGGACHAKANPIRDRKSKWFASVDSYPENSYPGFCSGTGYVTSMHVANEVYKISPNIPFFHLEDVYVSLCIKKLGFKLQRISGFSAGRPKMDPCLYKGGQLITAHRLTPAMLQAVWKGQCKKKHP